MRAYISIRIGALGFKAIETSLVILIGHFLKFMLVMCSQL